MDSKMSIHDQLLILDKVESILSEISYYDEDSCPEIFNILFNNIDDIHHDLKESVKKSLEKDIGELTEESFKNILLS